MGTLIFSQTAIFRLQQLGNQYYSLTGIRHKLSNQDGVMDLLRDAVLSRDGQVKVSYESFVMELNKRQIDALANNGINVQQPLQAPSTTNASQAK
jgi:hypothetical protein